MFSSTVLSIRLQGCSFALAWLWCFFFYNQAFPVSQTQAIFFLAGAVLAAGTGLVFKKVFTEDTRRTLVPFFCFVLALGTLLTFLYNTQGPLANSEAFLYILTAVIGFSFWSVIFEWIRCYALFKMDVTTLVALINIFTSACLYYLLYCLKEEYFIIAFAILPLISAVFYYVNRSQAITQEKDAVDVDRTANMQISSFRRMYPYLIFLFTILLSVGFFHRFAHANGMTDEIAAPLGMIVIIALTIVFLWFLFSRKVGMSIIQYLCLTLLFVLEWLVVFGTPDTAYLISMISGALLALTVFLAVIFSIDLTKTFSERLEKTCGFFMGIGLLSLLLGEVLFWIVIGVSPYEDLSTIAAAVFLLIPITFLILLLGKRHWIAYEYLPSEIEHPDDRIVIDDIEQYLSKTMTMISLGAHESLLEEKIDYSVIEEGTLWNERIAELCEKNGFSPRQMEIFSYLARGRNADYIANKLVISTSTVRTHIANIYRKLDIHTQQELLDIIFR